MVQRFYPQSIHPIVHPLLTCSSIQPSAAFRSEAEQGHRLCHPGGHSISFGKDIKALPSLPAPSPESPLLQHGHSISRGHQPLNLNHYATKKSVAESMLDVALFMSNATRLKVVLEQGPSSQYYATLIALISVSLLLQVVIGILLVVIGKPSLQSDFLPWCPLVVGKGPACP